MNSLAPTPDSLFEESEIVFPRQSSQSIQFDGAPVCCLDTGVLEVPANFEGAGFACVIERVALHVLSSTLPTPEDLAELFNKCSDQFRAILYEKLADRVDVPSQIVITPGDVRKSLALGDR